MVKIVLKIIYHCFTLFNIPPLTTSTTKNRSDKNDRGKYLALLILPTALNRIIELFSSTVRKASSFHSEESEIFEVAMNGCLERNQH